MQLGMFFTGVSPSGGAANVWSVILGGNLDLSISMTTINTLSAFGMLNKNHLKSISFSESQLFIFSSYFIYSRNDAGVVIHSWRHNLQSRRIGYSIRTHWLIRYRPHNSTLPRFINSTVSTERSPYSRSHFEDLLIAADHFHHCICYRHQFVFVRAVHMAGVCLSNLIDRIVYVTISIYFLLIPYHLISIDRFLLPVLVCRGLRMLSVLQSRGFSDKNTKIVWPLPSKPVFKIRALRYFC